RHLVSVTPCAAAVRSAVRHGRSDVTADSAARSTAASARCDADRTAAIATTAPQATNTTATTPTSQRVALPRSSAIRDDIGASPTSPAFLVGGSRFGRRADLLGGTGRRREAAVGLQRDRGPALDADRWQRGENTPWWASLDTDLDLGP